MEKGLFQMFAFVAVLIVVATIATAVMISSNKNGAAAPTNGAAITNGTNGAAA